MLINKCMGHSEAIVDDSTDNNRPALIFVGAHKPVPKYLWLSPSLQTRGSAQRKRPKNYVKKKTAPTFKTITSKSIVDTRGERPMCRLFCR